MEAENMLHQNDGVWAHMLHGAQCRMALNGAWRSMPHGALHGSRHCANCELRAQC